VRRAAGERLGDRRVPGQPQPTGIEIESYDRYTPGDDLRHLDWSALARLDTLLVRRFTAEREVVFHVLLDASASMGVPVQDRKFAVACELVMALAYVALEAGDAVVLAPLGGHPARRGARALRRAPGVRAVAEHLAATTPRGALDLGQALAGYARRQRRPGAAIVVSDLLFEPAGLEPGIAALRARGFDVLLLQVLGAHERDPGGEFAHATLRDVESGATHPVTLTPALLARYRELLDSHVASLAALAARVGATYARLDSDAPVRTFVTETLVRVGVVRRR